MSTADWIGSAGVALLLIAFAANALGKLAATSRAYHAINAIGAALAAWASLQIGFVPFVVLESTWCLVALAGFVRAGAPARA